MVKAQGGNGGKEWDDGFNYEGVTKIHVRAGYDGIQFIKFEYVKAGKTIVGPIHGVSGLGMTQTVCNVSLTLYILTKNLAV